MIKIIFLGVGKVKEYGKKDFKNTLEKPWQSAMKKEKVHGVINASLLGFEGDMVSDTKSHGGVEKAIFANSMQNYKIWKEFLKNDEMSYGDMGENITIDGLDENSVCIGDIHKIGDLVLQVSQPRKPCFKLSKFFNNTNFTNEIFKTGRTGWYYRVISEGSCKCDDELEIIKKDETNMSIMEINKLFYAPKENMHLLEKFKNLKTITKGWSESIQKRIDGTYNNEYMRSLD